MKFSENVGLDTFLSNTTSEDNQSFNVIIKEAEIQFQKKVLQKKKFIWSFFFNYL